MSSNIARGDISRAGVIFFIRPSTAGIIRVRVLFEGGSYMRKYGISLVVSGSAKFDSLF